MNTIKKNLSMSPTLDYRKKNHTKQAKVNL